VATWFLHLSHVIALHPSHLLHSSHLFAPTSGLYSLKYY
jgi:hypothetical protein